jgi:hypothetical protein
VTCTGAFEFQQKMSGTETNDVVCNCKCKHCADNLTRLNSISGTLIELYSMIKYLELALENTKASIIILKEAEDSDSRKEELYSKK